MLDVLWSLGSFVVAIGFLIAIHEYGHFAVARALGVKVLRYSIGFGKIVWSHRSERSGTEYALSLVPLGGYVKMLDEREAPVAEAELPQAFNRQAPWRRMLIVLAGPAANFLVAIAAYWLVFVIGVTALKPVIGDVPEGSAAHAAGLQRGDTVTRLNDSPVPTWNDLRTLLLKAALNQSTVPVELQSADGSTRRAMLDASSLSSDPQELFEQSGLHPYRPSIPAVLDEVFAGGAAAQAGFLSGDHVRSVDGEPVADWDEWREWIQAHAGHRVEVVVERAGQQLSLPLIVGSEALDGRRIGRFGASVEVDPQLWQDLRAQHRYGPLEAIPQALLRTWDMSALTLRLLAKMIVGDVSLRNVSGPVHIAQYAGYSASAGVAAFLGFVAIVSVSLAVLNLLPIPVLDGGHLLYIAAEAVKGSPVSMQTQMVGQQIGLLLLLMLMSLAFYNDIIRLTG